jgi:hypothetical protein
MLPNALFTSLSRPWGLLRWVLLSIVVALGLVLHSDELVWAKPTPNPWPAPEPRLVPTQQQPVAIDASVPMPLSPAKLYLVSPHYPYDWLTRRSQSPQALTQFQALFGLALAQQGQGQFSLVASRTEANYIISLTCGGLVLCGRYQVAISDGATHRTLLTFNLPGQPIPLMPPPVAHDSQQLAEALYHWLPQVQAGQVGAY